MTNDYRPITEQELKRGYYYCDVCGSQMLHDWHSGITNQEFETWPENAPIPDDVFMCCKCASGLEWDEWDAANSDNTY
ncbi:hypothetical protein I8752_22645 [Nostocaceae cyanobacterium CENA369]|uniref:Uncharacterized protein n=1 Tax=Dendronalium phyllosphericum CENA369 TaxID=1725256 RepID=A0A8J7I9T6_9NOST|nr:hypothetical protein [Dendronalium phyllosphericum]MBH8575751.1 hypothetical protein [Dendronalium phyllosphericum CENA369]